MTLSILFALAGCLAVNPGTDQIAARDLAPVLPVLAGSDVPVSLAPSPGTPRVFRIPELRRLAARLKVDAEPAAELCFERPLAPLDPARLLDAMRRELPRARIEIADYSRIPAPLGDLEFPLRGLRRSTGGGVWSGSVRYAGNRRFAVWARVRVEVAAWRVIAAEEIKAGRVIRETQPRLEERWEFPGTERFAESIPDAAGKLACMPIRAGAAIRDGWLDEPKDVMRGDTVKVEVRSGGARLELEALAESSGSVGAVIPVLNPTSGKRFPARVEGRGRVSVGKGPS